MGVPSQPPAPAPAASVERRKRRRPRPEPAQVDVRAAQPLHGEQHLLRRLLDHPLGGRADRRQLLPRGGGDLLRQLLRRVRWPGGAADAHPERVRGGAGLARRRDHVWRGAGDPRLQVGAGGDGHRRHRHLRRSTRRAGRSGWRGSTCWRTRSRGRSGTSSGCRFRSPPGCWSAGHRAEQPARRRWRRRWGCGRSRRWC